MKSKSVVLMIVSLGFGLIAAIGISQVMGNNNGPAAPAVERAQVLVASADLKVGDDLTEENVSIEHWPMEVIPEDAVREFTQIEHRKITTRLKAGLPIMMGDSIDGKDFGVPPIPNGYKLVAIKVSAEDTLNGLLQPGHKVDVIGVVNVRSEAPNSRGRTETVSETFLKNIEVFSVDGRTRHTGTHEVNGGNAIIGVLVTEQQSELIVLVQKVAKLRLVFRGADDTDEEGGFTDYADFYNSVFGKSAEPVDDEDGENSRPTRPGATWSMGVWSSEGFQEVEFNGNRRLTPTQSSFSAGDTDDSDDYDRSDEIESGLEEDQYPGE